MFGRLFGKSKKNKGGAPRDVSVNQPTIGLCFDFERDIGFESKYLCDVGLNHILETLASQRLQATFNCPAKLCEIAPDHIAKIVTHGHEIVAMGYADETPKDLTDEAINQLVFACRTAFEKRGLRPIGFRSPNSGWDDRLSNELAQQGFLYSAEHDHAKQPHELISNDKPLLRIPLRTDDRGLRRSEDTYNATVSKHLRAARKAIQNNHFCAIVFHPWILAEDMERMEHWESWLRFVVNSGAKVGPLQNAIPDAMRKGDSTQ